ncbi:MAG: MarR family transcriptional regulator [Acholeplasmataceae bacterium]|nr:MarR family transcriptional regulator [Acholeplasmataceae bacterium]
MEYASARKIIQALQELYQDQKRHLKLPFIGEEAILLYLLNQSDKNQVTPSEISERLNVSSARIAAGLNRLQDKKYITREIDKDDRRKIIIQLTKAGINTAETMKASKFTRVYQVFNKLGKEDTDELLRIIEKLKAITKEESAHVETQKC